MDGKNLVSLIRDRRGNAMVEMALILPILLLLVFGITEFGRAWLQVNLMHTATREGARLAVVTGPDVAAVTARVDAILDAANIEATSIEVLPFDPDADPLERKTTVRVTSDFVVIPGKVLDMFEPVISLSAQTTMRQE
jgi:hypothetical protein